MPPIDFDSRNDWLIFLKIFNDFFKFLFCSDIQRRQKCCGSFCLCAFWQPSLRWVVCGPKISRTVKTGWPLVYVNFGVGDQDHIRYIVQEDRGEVDLYREKWFIIILFNQLDFSRMYNSLKTSVVKIYKCS